MPTLFSYRYGPYLPSCIIQQLPGYSRPVYLDLRDIIWNM